MTAAATEPLVDGVPPGPKAPLPMQTLATLLRQRPYLERARRKYGSMFSVRVTGVGHLVVITDPALIKHTFTAPPEVLHAGEESPLRPVLGDHSLLAIDE